MSESKKSLQELMEEARKGSPLNKLTHQQASLKANNSLKQGVPTNKVTKGVFKKGNVPWSTGIKGKNTPWAQTRKERAKDMTEEERKKYFGYIENHTEKTKEQMSESAKQRWAKTMKRVMADGVEYNNHNDASEKLGVHKDTVIYRIKNKSERWNGWYYIND